MTAPKPRQPNRLRVWQTLKTSRRHQHPTQTPEPTTPDTTPDTEPEPTTPDTTPDTEPEPTTPDAGDSGAAELLTAAAETSVGRSVRGETRIGIAPLDSGFVLASTTFETDADGNSSVIVSSVDSPSSTEARYVDGALYIRLPPELLSSYGVDAASGRTWLTADEETAAELGLTCASPLSTMAPGMSTTDCDPLGDTAALLPEFGDNATIVGREAVRGVDVSVVRLAVSIGDLLAGAQGSLPDSPDSEDEFAGGDPLEAMFALIEGDIHIDVWIDDDKRIHRMVVDLASFIAGMAESAGEDPGEIPQLVATIDSYDHDADIIVEAPPPDQVIGDFGDLTDLGPDTY